MYYEVFRGQAYEGKLTFRVGRIAQRFPLCAVSSAAHASGIIMWNCVS